MDCHPTQTPAEGRTERHLRQCAELAELAMQLARLAAARALTEAQTEPTQAATSPRRHPDATATFTRLATTVRQLIATENRVATGRDQAQTKTYTSRPDPRRKPVQSGFYDATKNHPDQKNLCREIEQRIDAELIAQPTATIAKIFFTVAEEFDPHLDIDFRHMSDELLGHGEVWDEPTDARCRNSRPDD